MGDLVSGVQIQRIYLVCILYPAAFLQSNVGGQSHSKAHCRTSQLRFTLFLSSVRVPPESRPSTLGFGDSSISIVNVGGLRCMCNTIWKKKLLFGLASRELQVRAAAVISFIRALHSMNRFCNSI